jgi:uncharacterized protein
MRSPEAQHRLVRQKSDEETSSVKIALSMFISAYQTLISPVGSGRCAFTPSCSHFAAQAIHEKGIFVGICMTGDRLLRDRPFVGMDRKYTLLPNGTFYDPVVKDSGLRR